MDHNAKPQTELLRLCCLPGLSQPVPETCWAVPVTQADPGHPWSAWLGPLPIHGQDTTGLPGGP
jgi:hypothetical protein